MPTYLFDTNHITLLEVCQQPLTGRFISSPTGDVTTSIVCIQEVMKGRLAAIATARRPNELIRGYELFRESVHMVAQFPVVDFDVIAENYYHRIRALRPKIGKQDQRIAATALAYGLTLLTTNTKDFVGIPGLQLDDWST